MKSLKKFLENKLKLKVNETRSNVDHPWKIKFPGYTFSLTCKGLIKRKVAAESIKRFKDRVREITRRIRGISLRDMMYGLVIYLRGWMGYFGFAEMKSLFKDLDKWIRRCLRSMMWKQNGDVEAIRSYAKEVLAVNLHGIPVKVLMAHGV